MARLTKKENEMENSKKKTHHECENSPYERRALKKRALDEKCDRAIELVISLCQKSENSIEYSEELDMALDLLADAHTIALDLRTDAHRFCQ
jgi:hypothetical protein